MESLKIILVNVVKFSKKGILLSSPIILKFNLLKILIILRPFATSDFFVKNVHSARERSSATVFTAILRALFIGKKKFS